MSIKLNKIPPDLLVVTLLIWTQIFLVVFDFTTSLRAGVGFLFVAFIPGYVLQTFLLDNTRVVYISIRRLILAVPISLSVAVLLGLAGLVIDPKSINNIVQVMLIGIFDFICIGLAVFRRKNAKIRGYKYFLVFIFTLYFLVTSFVIIYPLFK